MDTTKEIKEIMAAMCLESACPEGDCEDCPLDFEDPTKVKQLTSVIGDIEEHFLNAGWTPPEPVDPLEKTRERMRKLCQNQDCSMDCLGCPLDYHDELKVKLMLPALNGLDS